MLETGKKERLRDLPAVDAVLRDPAGERLVGRHGRAKATAAVRESLDRLRREILAGGEPDISERVVASAASLILSGRGLRRVVNATGVVLHTNLGRSVLSERAAAAVAEAARNYSNLEYDLSSGTRGSRYDHAVPLLKESTTARARPCSRSRRWSPARRIPQRSSSRVASSSRSGAASASPRCSSSPARGCGRSAPRTAPGSPITRGP